MEEVLLSTDETRRRLEILLSESEEFDCLSAFFSMPAFDWVNQHWESKNVRLAIRGRPNDFMSGATSLAAVKAALTVGWRVFIHSALHAKVFSFPNVVVVGSGNLTANGLNLSSSGGNVEFSLITEKTTSIVKILDQVFATATPINVDAIERMTAFLNTQSKTANVDCDWPSNVLSVNRETVFCADFPMHSFRHDLTNEEEPWQSIEKHLVSENVSAALDEICRSVAYNWLMRTVEKNGGAARFGMLSKALHNDVADDVGPYRREIKQLLANLLSFVMANSKNELEVVRPNHSMLVRKRNPS